MREQGYAVQDFGTDSADAVDYPDVVHPLCRWLSGDRRGILLCGSGNGVAMTANKYSHIRAAVCWSGELARLARAHNNANVLCLPARFITTNQALEMLHLFLTTAFEGGRHQRRVDKIARESFPC